MKSKQEVIQEAYGQYWPEVEKDIVQECYICLINERSTLVAWNDLLMIAHKTDNHLYMPISLKGIENNNGWTRIESEEDLPKDDDKEYCIANENGIFGFIASGWQVVAKWKNETCTHYQPIIKPQAPIY